MTSRTCETDRGWWLPFGPFSFFLPDHFHTMLFILANATNADDSGRNILIGLIGLGIVLVAAGIAFVPAAAARIRRHPHTEAITAVAVLWGLLTAAYAVYTVVQQMTWKQEQYNTMMEGYDNQMAGIAAPPPLSWPACAGICVVYAALILWSVRPPRTASGFPVQPRQTRPPGERASDRKTEKND